MPRLRLPRFGRRWQPIAAFIVRAELLAHYPEGSEEPWYQPVVLYGFWYEQRWYDAEQRLPLIAPEGGTEQGTVFLQRFREGTRVPGRFPVGQPQQARIEDS